MPITDGLTRPSEKVDTLKDLISEAAAGGDERAVIEAARRLAELRSDQSDLPSEAEMLAGQDEFPVPVHTPDNLG